MKEKLENIEHKIRNFKYWFLEENDRTDERKYLNM